MIAGAGRWLIAIRRYLVAMAVGNLLWEAAQLPLYTLWRTGTPADIAGAVFHCVLGDVAIATIALVSALVVFGSPAWPDEKFRSVLIATLAGGIGYTTFSEYLHHPARVLGLQQMDADASPARHRRCASGAVGDGPDPLPSHGRLAAREGRS